MLKELYRYRSFGDARLSPIGQSHPRVDPKDFPDPLWFVESQIQPRAQAKLEHRALGEGHDFSPKFHHLRATTELVDGSAQAVAVVPGSAHLG